MARIDGARYGHTNLTARDWRALASFYGDVFGCVAVPPEQCHVRGPGETAHELIGGAGHRL